MIGCASGASFRLRVLALGVVAIAFHSGPARGQDVPDAGATDEPHPVYSADERWVRPTLIGVGGLFAAAAGVGLVVQRLRMRDVVPTAASHEEDPGADRH